jgi:hypothetical protein
VGSDGVVDLAESRDFHREGVAVVDRGAVEVLVFEGFEESLDDSVGLRGSDPGPDVTQDGIGTVERGPETFWRGSTDPLSETRAIGAGAWPMITPAASMMSITPRSARRSVRLSRRCASATARSRHRSASRASASRGDGGRQAVLGDVVDHRADPPDPAGRGLELAEVGLPDPVAAGGWVVKDAPTKHRPRFAVSPGTRAAAATPAGVRPVARSRSTPRARRRASSPRPCDAPTPARQRHTSPPTRRSRQPEARATAPYRHPRPAAEPADADTYVPGYRPVQRTSKPAFPPPLLGPRGLRRDLAHMLSPSRQIRSCTVASANASFSCSISARCLRSIEVPFLPPGPGIMFSSPAWPPSRKPVPPLRDRLPRRAVPPRRLGNRQLTRQHRQHNPHPLLDRQLRMPAPTHQPILPAGP